MTKHSGLTVSIVHDFRNLLTAIIGSADAILSRPGLDAESRADLAHIREAALRGTALTGQRLPADHRPRPIAVNAAIRATSRLLSHGVALTLDLPEPGGFASIVPADLDRILLNLVGNARHAMEADGGITVRTQVRTVQAREERFPDPIPPGDYVTIGVADTGPGIARDVLPRIFEPRFTTRPGRGGQGLGLPAVRDLAHAHGGFVTVESVEGQGAVFEISLPARPGEAPDPGVVPSGRVVLLVEDEALLRQIAERALRQAGWTVLAVETAEAALDLLRDRAIDLTISDVTLPGMDGVSLAREALALRPRSRVILTSGYDIASCAPGVAFLAKPYSREDLLAAAFSMERGLPPG